MEPWCKRTLAFFIMSSTTWDSLFVPLWRKLKDSQCLVLPLQSPDSLTIQYELNGSGYLQFCTNVW